MREPVNKGYLFSREMFIGAKTLWKCPDFRNENNERHARIHAEGDKIVRTVSVRGRYGKVNV